MRSFDQCSKFKPKSNLKMPQFSVLLVLEIFVLQATMLGDCFDLWRW